MIVLYGAFVLNIWKRTHAMSCNLFTDVGLELFGSYSSFAGSRSLSLPDQARGPLTKKFLAQMRFLSVFDSDGDPDYKTGCYNH